MHEHYFNTLNVMTPFPHSIGLDATLIEARTFMKEHGIRHLPVTKDGELHGIITDHDIKIMLSPEFGYPDPKELMVFDVYVAEPYIVDISTRLSAIASTLVERKIGSAIVTKNDKLVGILTTRDVCRVLAKFLLDQENPEDGEVA